MYLSILLLPLLGSLSAGFFGRFIGAKGAQITTTSMLFLATILAWTAFYEVALSNSPVVINLTSWLDIEALTVNWAFQFDTLTVSMLITVLTVSSFVHLYTISYMAHDPHNQRFFSFLSLFTFSMLVLVTGNNYLILFLGWEFVGIASYLLIGFWFTRAQATKSANQSFVTNRVGDYSLTVAFFALFWLFGALDYSTVYSTAYLMNDNVLSIIVLFMLGGVAGKSVQVGLHSWLPSSMEGPTPVSSLLHSATLVTAGIYLLLRSSPLLEFASTALIVIVWLGAITAFIGASMGLLQNDMKRIIAMSTMSQCGYMVMACGLSQYDVALFHLVNHGFFKSMLFLAAGAVIHAMADQQDVRRLGGLRSFLPLTYTAMLVGSFSLMAVPFLTGFYSKDLILELSYGAYSLPGIVVFILGSVAALFTAFYSTRLLTLVFFSTPNAPKVDYENTHESDTYTFIPLIVLSLMSIFFGYIGKDAYVGMGSDFFGSALFTHPNNVYLVEAEFNLPVLIKWLPAIFTLIGFLAGFSLYQYPSVAKYAINITKSKLGYSLFSFFNGKYKFDPLLNGFTTNSSFKLGLILSKVFDRGIIEILGPYGLSVSLVSMSNKLSQFDTGKLFNQQEQLKLTNNTDALSNSGGVTLNSLYIMLGLIVLLLLVLGVGLLNLSSSTMILGIKLGLLFLLLLLVY